MKVLLDTCVWGGSRNAITAAGYDVIWAGDWPSDPGDEEILAQAHAEGRILVTLDKDFGELAVVREHPHSGIVASWTSPRLGRRSFTFRSWHATAANSPKAQLLL